MRDGVMLPNQRMQPTASRCALAAADAARSAMRVDRALLTMCARIAMGARFWIITLLSAALQGAGAGFGVTVLGTVIGWLVEAMIGRPVASGWEFVPLPIVMPILNTLGGVMVALLGALSGRWGRGLVIGAIVHGLVFGWLVVLLGASLAVSVWVFVVGLLAGGTAGALGGAVAQRRSQV